MIDVDFFTSAIQGLSNTTFFPEKPKECPENCQTCDKNGDCLKCKNGFRLRQRVCKSKGNCCNMVWLNLYKSISFLSIMSSRVRKQWRHYRQKWSHIHSIYWTIWSLLIITWLLGNHECQQRLQGCFPTLGDLPKYNFVRLQFGELCLNGNRSTVSFVLETR